MSVKLEKLKGSKVKLSFDVESEKFDKALDKAFEKKKETVEVPGFRKGKITKAMYLSRFGVESLYSDALDEVMNSEYVDYIVKNKVDVCAQPEVDVDWTTVKQGSNIKFVITVAVYPEVKLGQYKGVEVKKEVVKVTANDIKAYVKRILKQHAELETVEDRALEKDDTAVFDFLGTVDGVPFDGGKADNYSLVIGSGQLIPGFEDQMVGMNVEEEKDVVVTFPKDYHASNLAGKEAVFKVKLHEIKKEVLPELTDSFVCDELEVEGVKTAKEYKEFVRDLLLKEKTEASENKFNDDCINKVVKAAKLEVPEELVPSDAVADTAKIVNTSAKTAIFADDVITERKLLSDLKQLTFVGSIPPDCRAVSIGVSEVTGVDGFAKPGDKVDLLLVETDENRSATTNILLQDVLLLSINKNMNKNPESAVAADGTITTTAIDNPSIATFALRPDEVLKLISASKLGEIYLMLRPQNPTQEYLYNYGYTINSINSYKQQQSAPAPAPVATPEPAAVQPTPTVPTDAQKDTNKIEIIEGDKIKDSGN